MNSVQKKANVPAAAEGQPAAAQGDLAGVVRSFGLLAGAGLIGQAIGFLALVYVSHRVGAHGVGEYNFVLVIVNFFALFGNLGLDTLAVRAIASGRDRRAITTEVVTLKLAFAAIAFAVLLATRSLLPGDEVERSLVPILGLNLLILAVTLDWRVQAMRHFRALGSWRLIGQIAYGALVPVFVVEGASGVRAYAWLNLLGLAVTMAGLAWTVVRHRPGMPPVPNLSRMRARVRSGLPFMYTLAMLQVYAGIGIVILGYIGSASQVGVYVVANRLPSALIVVANMWINAFFPYAATQMGTDPKALLVQVGRIVTAMAVLGIGLAVGAALCAEGLMAWLFGDSFASAGAPTAVLAAAAAVTLVDATFGNVLQAAHFEGAYARAITLCVLINVGANVVLIPAAGALGAALSTLIAELVLGGMLIVMVSRRVGTVVPSWNRIARGLCAAGLMACGVLATRQFGPGIAVGTAIVTFAGAAVFLRALDPTLANRDRGAGGAM